MRVLLAVDGSKSSVDAADVLRHLATPEEVIILNVLDIPDVKYPSLWLKMKDLPHIVETEMYRDAQEILERLKTHLPSETALFSSQIEKGKPAEVILNVASRSKVDLILLGARGLNRISELVFGSVSHTVMTYASCPTFILKSPVSQLQHVLLPIEGGGDIQVSTAFFANHPFRIRPSITVFHAVPLDQFEWMEGALVSESYREELIVAGKVLTDQVVAELTDLGYRAEPRVRYGPPAELIQTAVVETLPDLIVVGSHGRKGLSRFFMGSVSHSVVHRSTCSVLVVR